MLQGPSGSRLHSAPFSGDAPDDDNSPLLAPERFARPALPPLPTFAEMQPVFEAEIRSSGAAGLYARPCAVWICALRAAPSRTSWWKTVFRRLSASISAYNHVELLLVPRDPERQTSYAWTVDFPDPAKPHSGRVRMLAVNTRVAYSSAYWSCFRLGNLTAAEILGIQFFLGRQAGKLMNGRGLYANFMPLTRWFAGQSLPEEDSWFCSQLIAATLQWIRPAQFYYVNPRRTTPERLVAILIYEHCAVYHGGGSEAFRPLYDGTSDGVCVTEQLASAI